MVDEQNDVNPGGDEPLNQAGGERDASLLSEGGSADEEGISLDLNEAGAVTDLSAEETSGEIAPLEEEEEEGEVAPIEENASYASGGKADAIEKRWYILKVQSNREDSIREALIKRVKVAGLEDYFGEVIVPTELVTEFKSGKKKISKRKLYPGYIVAHMAINDDTWFLVRETPGIGDFTGSAGHPSPMLDSEVSKIIAKQEEEKSEEAPKLKIGFTKGDKVKINEGTFANFSGDVDAIDQTNGRVTVIIYIFGRPTPVELDYWQVELVD